MARNTDCCNEEMAQRACGSGPEVMCKFMKI